jgi:hypothetical protein
MNVVTTTWRQLVRRRLWPVALLLLAALVAVPVLLAREAEPVPAPADPVPVTTTKADDAIAEPVVAKVTPEDRSRRRRVLGVRKDPFAPAPPKKSKNKESTAADTATVAEDAVGGSTVPSSGSGVAVSVPTPAEPEKKPRTYEAESLIVRFGDGEAESLERLVLEKLQPLPDDETPLLIYMGLTGDGKKAIFMVDASLEAAGDGDCKPHKSNCETIELAAGETEFFDVADPETGEVAGSLQLDIVDIKRKGDADVN